MRIKYIIFLFLLVILVFFTSLSSMYPDLFQIFKGEYGIIENFQVILLIFILYLNISNRKKLKKFYKNIYWFKNFLISFLIFEEISFLSYEKFSFLSSYNQQSELNLHNARFLKLSFDIIPDSFYSLSLGFLIYNLVILVIGFGSFLPIKSNIKFLFFEKKYCFFSLIYLFNFLFSNLLLNFNLINTTILTDESLELFLYFIFWSDTKDKIKNVRNIR